MCSPVSWKSSIVVGKTLNERIVMTTMPTVESSFSPLHHIVTGPLKAALLNCALDLALFDILTQPATGDAVATVLNLHPGNTCRLMNAPTGVGTM